MNSMCSVDPADNNHFWRTLDDLVTASEIVIDRAKGSAHPHFSDLVYPLDYGYLDGTTAGDGGGIDIWIGNAEERRVAAIACTVDGYKRDAEIKILLGCTEDDQAAISYFLNTVARLPCIILVRPLDQRSPFHLSPAPTTELLITPRG